MNELLKAIDEGTVTACRSCDSLFRRLIDDNGNFVILTLANSTMEVCPRCDEMNTNYLVSQMNKGVNEDINALFD